MKKLYLIGCLLCIVNFCFAQLTVTTNPASATICANNAVSITATALPVSYTISSIPTNLESDLGINILADAGVVITPYSAGSSLDDCRWDNITLPFSFRFYGNVFNAVNISSNGWVGLGPTNSTTTGLGVALPNAAAPNNVIHGITADFDLRTASGGTLEYYETGFAPNRKFIISYNNVRFFSGGGFATFQIVLFETTNQVEIHTYDCSNTTLAKAQGIENANGTVAQVVSGRNNTSNWTATGYTNSYRFTPDVINYTWSPAAGLNTTSGATVIASPNNTTTYTVNAINPSNGQTGSSNVTVTISPASYTLAGTPGGVQICQNITVSPTGTMYRDGNCNLIAGILPSGSSPVSNSINTCVKVDTGANKMGSTFLYVARKYDIEPLLNPYPAINTATITLYFLQSEFDNYNSKASDSSQKQLPTGPSDLTGIANLTLRQFHGTGTNPLNYSGPSEDFTTATSGFTVVWNATRNWWEVTVPVTGFSGFYISTPKLGTLATNINYFTGATIDKKNVLKWMVNCTANEVDFKIERSPDAIHFTELKRLHASKTRCSQPFEITDDNPLSGINYYRLKIIDIDGKEINSNIVSLSLKSKGFEIVGVSPNPVTTENAVIKISSDEKININIEVFDLTGRTIIKQSLSILPGNNLIPVNTQKLVRGLYQVSVYTNDQNPQTVKLIKQ